MNLLDKNLNALNPINPELAAKIRQKISSGNVRAIKDENFYSKELPQQLQTIRQHIEKAEQPDIIIHLGLGLGRHLLDYIKKPHPLNKYLVIVEPDLDLFINFLMKVDAAAFLKHPNLCWLIEPNEQQLMQELILLLQKPSFGECVENSLILNWGYSHPFFLIFQETWNRFKQSIKADLESNPMDAYFGLMNFLDNRETSQKAPFISEFTDCFKGKPGLLIGTGPSLKFSLVEIKKHAGDFVIFCVDSACQILQANNIKFNLTGSIEREKATSKHYENVQTDDKFLVTTPIIHPNTYRAFKGNVIHINRPHHYLPWFYPKEPVEHVAMNSVTHIGLFTLWQMGCDPIYLVGQDLAFDPVTLKTHADGYQMGKNLDQATEADWKILKTIGNNGKEILTDKDWFHFGELISQMIEKYRITCFNVIPNDYGMKIKGAQQIEPDKAFAEISLSEISTSYTLGEIYNQTTLHLEERKYSIEKIIEETTGWLQEMIKNCIEISQEIYDFYLENPPDGNSGKKMQNYLNFFKTLEKKSLEINEGDFFEPLFRKIMLVYQSKLIQVSHSLQTLDGNNPETLKKKLSIPLTWFSESIVMGELILRRIKSASPNEPRNKEPASH